PVLPAPETQPLERKSSPVEYGREKLPPVARAQDSRDFLIIREPVSLELRKDELAVDEDLERTPPALDEGRLHLEVPLKLCGKPCRRGLVASHHAVLDLDAHG